MNRTVLAAAALLAALSCHAGVAHAADALAPLRDYLKRPTADRPDLAAQPFAAVPLTKADAGTARDLLWADYAAAARTARLAEWQAKAITLNGKTLKFAARPIGNAPKTGRSLYISLHGGGNAPASVNDEQWENQKNLYDPPASLYVAPRAPSDTWDLWHEPTVDPLLDRLIQDCILFENVDPNRVYLMGYSAGGDGVYQLAPRLADRFAAAAMMAGHPNDASPLGLRNLPFAIHVGALDDAYDRNKVAREWGDKLDALQKADPAGYTHVVELHPGRGHWMNREDRAALPWMAGFTRNLTPTKVVWQQSRAPHDRFYWLTIPAADAKPDQGVVATRDGQTIMLDRVTNAPHVGVLLSDAMLDLDRPVRVIQNGRVLFDGVVPRTIRTIQSTLAARGDPAGVFPASVTVDTAK